MMKPLDAGSSTDTPVFLVGAPRSGTSVLYKALCLHRDVAYISNWVRRAPGLPQLAALNRITTYAPAYRRRAWFNGDSNAYIYGGRRSLLRRAFPMPVEGEPLYARCGLLRDAPDADTNADVEALRRSVRTVVKATGARVFVNKRIDNNRRIELLLQAFPTARFARIVRDGRAVAYSLSHVDWWDDTTVWWYGGTPRDWADEGRDPWELCARHWVYENEALERGMRSVPPAQQLHITYEEFVQQPLDKLHELAKFSGLPANRAWDDELTKLQFPNRNDNWQVRLAPEIASRVTELQQHVLHAHHYV